MEEMRCGRILVSEHSYRTLDTVVCLDGVLWQLEMESHESLLPLGGSVVAQA